MKYIILKDFSLSDDTIFGENFNPNDIKLIEKDEPDATMGTVFHSDEFNNYMDFADQCVIDFMEYLCDNGYIIPYYKYREQRINEIFE